MAACLCRRVLFTNFALYRRIVHYTARRTLLSESYACDEQWKKRLDTPLLQKVDVGEFAIKIQDKLDKEGKASAIDIDILANSLDRIDPIQLDFVQTLFFRFRKCSEAIKVQESTPYALIRALLKFNETERLFEILEDKVNYGIFLDYFTANMLLDHFLERKNWMDASRIAVDMMLQEDFVHPITRMLSWYACHQLWRHPPPPPEVTTEEQPAQEEAEELWMKVDFIINPFYDDHWDIPRHSQKVGKTLTMVAGQQDDLLGRSYQLIGWGMYEKFDRGLDLLLQWAEAGNQEAVSKDALLSFRQSLEDYETREPLEPKDPGEMILDDVTPYFSEEEKTDFLERLKVLEDQIQGQVVDVDLEPDLHSLVQKSVSSVQDHDISEQQKLYVEWNKRRQELLDSEIKELMQERRKVEIAQRLKELRDKEEKLKYFEQQDQIRLGMSRAPEIKPLIHKTEEETFVAPPGERGARTS